MSKEEAAAAGSTPAPAAAPADDPFDGLFRDLPPARSQPVKKEEAKQPGDEEEGGKKRKVEGNPDPQKRPRGEGEGTGTTTTVELEGALQKISAALRSSKVEKFRKAAELLLKLIVDMHAENRGQFYSVRLCFVSRVRFPLSRV